LTRDRSKLGAWNGPGSKPGTTVDASAAIAAPEKCRFRLARLSPKRHRERCFRESLASDSRDSHPIPVSEAPARAHFPKFFSQAVLRVARIAISPPRRCAHAPRQLGETLQHRS
jgi:hypothetical protein